MYRSKFSWKSGSLGTGWPSRSDRKIVISLEHSPGEAGSGNNASIHVGNDELIPVRSRGDQCLFGPVYGALMLNLRRNTSNKASDCSESKKCFALFKTGREMLNVPSAVFVLTKFGGYDIFAFGKFVA